MLLMYMLFILYLAWLIVDIIKVMRRARTNGISGDAYRSLAINLWICAAAAIVVVLASVKGNSRPSVADYVIVACLAPFTKTHTESISVLLDSLRHTNPGNGGVG